MKSASKKYHQIMNHNITKFKILFNHNGLCINGCFFYTGNFKVQNYTPERFAKWFSIWMNFKMQALAHFEIFKIPNYYYPLNWTSEIDSSGSGKVNWGSLLKTLLKTSYDHHRFLSSPQYVWDLNTVIIIELKQRSR